MSPDLCTPTHQWTAQCDLGSIATELQQGRFHAFLWAVCMMGADDRHTASFHMHASFNCVEHRTCSEDCCGRLHWLGTSRGLSAGPLQPSTDLRS